VDPDIPGYRIDSVIGRGGMGVVYQAEHLHLRRVVALKVLAPELVQSEGFRERFLRESRLAASIQHPHIVTVFDAGEVDGQLFIAMQYVEGTDLANLLRDRGRLEPAHALAVLSQVASALDAAHGRGLVHRDVKPANVLIAPERSYLTDFGLTKQVTAATAFTETGQFVGTIDYVAPEQIKGERLDARTDVYALGCVLYQALSGERPFPRDSEVAVIYAHLEDAPPSVCQRVQDLPPELDAVVARALAKRTDDRWPSCGALMDAARGAIAATESGAARLAEPVPEGLGTVDPGPTQPARPQPTQPSEERRATRVLPQPAQRTERAETVHDPLRRRGFPLGLAAALAAAAAVAIVLVIVLGGEEAGEAPPPFAGEVRVSDPVPIGSRPFGVAVGAGGVWVANFNEDAIKRVDPDTRRPGRAIPVGDGPFWTAVGGGAVWVAARDGGYRVDPGTGAAERIELPGQPVWVAIGAGDGYVWFASGGSDTVTAVDRRTGQVVETIEVGAEPRGIATAPGSVWVANSEDDTVTRLDSREREVIDTIPVGNDPNAIAIAENTVWVVNRDDDTVSRVDQSTGEPIGAPIRVGDGPFGIAFGEGLLWVTNADDDTVTRIDPQTARIVGDPLPVEGQPVGVRVADGAVWVTSNDDGSISRITP
jgi:YVTN family beta-propeller protein